MADAFVLTGTGANAAYEVGVLKAVTGSRWGRAEYEPVAPYCMCGTSMGALNAAAFVSASDDGFAKAVGWMESIWLQRIGVSSASSATGVFRVRAEPTQLFDFSAMARDPVTPVARLSKDMFHFVTHGAMRFAYAMAVDGAFADRAAKVMELNEWIDHSPLEEVAAFAANPWRVGKSKVHLRVSALDWRTGAVRTFNNADVQASGGRCVFAALAVPGVVPPVMVGGVPYADASIVMDRPLKPAVQAAPPNDPLVLHVVYVDASLTDIPLPPISNSFSTGYRLFMLALSRMVNNDIDRASAVNDKVGTLELLRLANEEVGASGADAEPSDPIQKRLNPSEALLWQNLTSGNERQITVHRYRPSNVPYGFDLAQYERSTLQQLIDDGYADAIKHDCEKNHCVMPR